MPLSQLLLFGNLVAAAALGVPLLAAYAIGRRLPVELFSSTQVLASCLFACTGLLCLVRWRLVGQARIAHIGCGFVVLGLLTLPLPLVGDLLPDGGRRDLVAPLARGAIAASALLLVARAHRSPEVDSRLRPLRVLLQSTAAVVTTYSLLSIVSAFLRPSERTPLYLVVGSLVAISWIGAGALFCARARSAQVSAWAGCTLLLLGGAAVLRVITIVAPLPWMFTAGTVSLIAAGVAVAGAGSSLLTVLRFQDRSLLRLSVDLRASEGRYAGERERQEERLHDVRSALAGIRCANGTLNRYASQLDERTKATLEDALAKELVRLEGLVDPNLADPSIDFRLADVLTPLVATERSLGSEILLHVADVAVHGRPADTAAVVQNLVVNARRYAPGSVITIHAGQRDGRVAINVEDSGPGIAERERAAVFERGVRGSTAAGVAGTGLGLFVSSRLMVEQHGSLTLREGAAGGACFVLDLPVAHTGQPATIDLTTNFSIDVPQQPVATVRTWAGGPTC